jgi:hypothetical protein
MAVQKPSFRSIVSEELKDEQEVIQPLHFDIWDNVVERINSEPQETRVQCESKTIDANKVGFLNGFADLIMDLTLEIKEHYGFYGIANDITVDKVIDCFENSVVVSINEDNNNEFSSDDDDTLS